jgi:ADP-heptose:LPS heptosyltransferase
MCLPASRYVAKNPVYGLETTYLFSNYTDVIELTDITDYVQLMSVRGSCSFPRIIFKPEILRHGQRIKPSHRAAEAFWFLGLDPDTVPVEELNYVRYRKDPTASTLFNTPIVAVCHTFSDRRRKLSEAVMFELLRYVQLEGYTPVLLGVTRRTFNPEVRYGRYKAPPDGCIDLVDKTPPDMLFKILDEAKVVVGPDNGILHLTGCTDTPIVGFYTIIDHKYVAPVRGNEIGKDCIAVTPQISCANCYPRTDIFSLCKGGQELSSPVEGYELRGDARCVQALSKGQLIEAVQEIL